MSKEKEPEPEPTIYTVTILDRNEITTYKRINQPEQQIVITYVAANLAPSTLRIMKDEYSLEAEQKAIKADIEQRLKRKAESYTV